MAQNKYDKYFSEWKPSTPSPSNYSSNIQLENQQRDIALQAYKNQVQTVNQQAKERKNAIQRIAETIIDIPMSTNRGLYKGIESVVDLGFAGVGKVAGWLGNENLENAIGEQIKRNLTGEFEKPIAGLSDDSYVRGNIIGKTLESVGQMAPAIALNLVPGGQVLGAGYMMASAAGGATEEGLMKAIP
jgi:hypothetical protein